MPGPGSMGWYLYGPRTEAVYESECKLGFKPGPVYKSKTKTYYKPDFL